MLETLSKSRFPTARKKNENSQRTYFWKVKSVFVEILQTIMGTLQMTVEFKKKITESEYVTV